MSYAAKTEVPVGKTQGEIRTLVMKAGADNFASFEEKNRVHIAFRLRERNIRFTIPMPVQNGQRAVDVKAFDQATRSRWRSLLLVIKAKLESVDSKVETFEEAFLAHIQMPSGRTVMEEMREPIAQRYLTNSNIPLLPGPSQ